MKNLKKIKRKKLFLYFIYCSISFFLILYIKHILMFFAQCFCVKKKSKNERKSGHEL